MASATLVLFGLAHSSPRRTERCRGYLDRCQNGGKHRPGLLPEKPLRCCRPIRACQQEVVHCREACTLSGVVKSAQLMVPQREVPVAPFHIGARALKHLRELGRLRLELVVLHRVELAQRSTRCKQRGAHALGKLTKWLTLCHRPR